MLDGARKLLLDEYYGNREIVAVSPHYAAYADEKYRHSLQVLGAGNFIIRHEPWFAGPGRRVRRSGENGGAAARHCPF